MIGGLTRSIVRHAGAAVALAVLAGCAGLSQQPVLDVEGNTLAGKVERVPAAAPEPEVLGGGATTSSLKRPFVERLQVEAVPGGEPAAAAAAALTPPPDPGDRLVDAAVPALALPAFIDVVFGEILEVPYATGPGVAARKDVIQLRSSGAIPARDFLQLVSTALVDYGVRIGGGDGLYQIVEDKSARARTPQFLRARSRPGTPAGLRPVVQFVPLRAVDAVSMRNILLHAFPQGSALDVQMDGVTGSVILKGLPEDVDAALGIIETMDTLAFAGAEVVQFKPTYWQVEPLRDQLVTVLSAEGWQVSSGTAKILPIHIVPIAFTNSMLIFVREAAARARVQHWLDYLDQPAQSGTDDQIFIYDVHNADAAVIAETANAVLSKTGGRPAATVRGGAAGAPSPGPTTDDSGGPAPGQLVVDPQGNRLIFSGSASNYQRLLPLLRRLDQPTPEVLIEVTVAEVTLTDETQYGVEFFANSVGGTGTSVDFGTAGGLGLAGTGLNVGFVSGDVTAALNAFAQNQQVNILSTPRLVARSGGAAHIQVGTDVPVITSQSAAEQQSGGGVRDVLQTVAFRSTGVLLNIEPVVFSTGRVDLTISQEVSSALPNPNQAIASPIISNRNLSTQLTLEDGGTAVLGGLIQDNVTRGKTGVPLLKDIPGIGNLFSVDSLSVERTELLVIITAYIVQGSEDRARFVDYLTGEINRSLGNDGLVLRTRLPRTP